MSATTITPDSSAGGKAQSASRSDALVFFGATGDLAHKKIFPALQAMIRKGNLDVPVIGVAKASWTIEQLKDRASSVLAIEANHLAEDVGGWHNPDGKPTDS